MRRLQLNHFVYTAREVGCTEENEKRVMDRVVAQVSADYPHSRKYKNTWTKFLHVPTNEIHYIVWYWD